MQNNTCCRMKVFSCIAVVTVIIILGSGLSSTGCFSASSSKLRTAFYRNFLFGLTSAVVFFSGFRVKKRNVAQFKLKCLKMLDFNVLFFLFFLNQSQFSLICAFLGELFSFKVQGVLRVAITSIKSVAFSFSLPFFRKNTTTLLHVSSERGLSFQMSHFNVL